MDEKSIWASMFDSDVKMDSGKSQLDATTSMLYDYYVSFIKAGFSKKDSMELVKAIVSSVVTTINKK